MPSTPSEPPSPPSEPKRSTTSWPIPEPGDVLSYAYLWKREADKGQEEGRKDRPVVVVLAQVRTADSIQIYVAPMTSNEQPTGKGVRVPPRVKTHLGLNADPSWIVTSEVNIFIWPGPDLRIANGDSPYYGAIPAALFTKVQGEIAANARPETIVKRSS